MGGEWNGGWFGDRLTWAGNLSSSSEAVLLKIRRGGLVGRGGGGASADKTTNTKWMHTDTHTHSCAATIDTPSPLVNPPPHTLYRLLGRNVVLQPHSASLLLMSSSHFQQGAAPFWSLLQVSVFPLHTTASSSLFSPPPRVEFVSFTRQSLTSCVSF